MSNQSVSVPTGVTPTLINGGLLPGAIIYNSDSTNTVWISSNPSISSGQGIPLGPLGSLSWKGGPVYAVAATGVTTGTLLNVTTDVANLDNPVAIGAAVATQLLAKGVPNVLIGATLNTGVITGAGGFTDWEMPGNVGSYASIALAITSPVNQSLVLSWLDANGQTVVSQRYVMAASPQDANSLQLQLKVRSPRLRITFSGGGLNATVNAYASNRDADDTILNGMQQTSRNFGSTHTAYVNEFFPLGYISNGKPTFMRMVVTNAAGGAKGYFGFTSMSATGVLETTDIVDSTGGFAGTDGSEIEKIIQLPPGCISPYFRPYFTGTYTVVVSLIPTA